MKTKVFFHKAITTGKDTYTGFQLGDDDVIDYNRGFVKIEMQGGRLVVPFSNIAAIVEVENEDSGD